MKHPWTQAKDQIIRRRWGTVIFCPKATAHAALPQHESKHTDCLCRPLPLVKQAISQEVELLLVGGHDKRHTFYEIRQSLTKK